MSMLIEKFSGANFYEAYLICQIKVIFYTLMKKIPNFKKCT